MKLLGAVFLTAAGAVIGLFKANELKKSARTLTEIMTLLEIMRNEICTRRTPLRKIFSSSCLPEFKTVQAFVNALGKKLESLGNTSFSQAWSDCLNFLELTSQSARQALISVGGSIGRYDAELQASAIDRCIRELDREYESIKESLVANEKMYIGLGTGLGAIFSIALL